MKKILVIMAKEPEVGKVKTRLSPQLTDQQAAELYKCFLIDKIGSIIELGKSIKGISLAVAFDPPSAQLFFQKLVPSWFILINQHGSDLGERLMHLFDHCLSSGFDRVVVIDSDSPNLPLEFLERAFEMLKNADVVLGPSQDGGYYLIGLTKRQPKLFNNIAWSTDSVLKQTTNQAKKLHLTVESLPKWYDVDTPQDLKRLQHEIAHLSGDELKPVNKTKEFLDSLGDCTP